MFGSVNTRDIYLLFQGSESFDLPAWYLIPWLGLAFIGSGLSARGAGELWWISACSLGGVWGVSPSQADGFGGVCLQGALLALEVAEVTVQKP